MSRPMSGVELTVSTATPGPAPPPGSWRPPWRYAWSGAPGSPWGPCTWWPGAALGSPCPSASPWMPGTWRTGCASSARSADDPGGLVHTLGRLGMDAPGLAAWARTPRGRRPGPGRGYAEVWGTGNGPLASWKRSGTGATPRRKWPMPSAGSTLLLLPAGLADVTWGGRCWCKAQDAARTVDLRAAWMRFAQAGRGRPGSRGNWVRRALLVQEGAFAMV